MALAEPEADLILWDGGNNYFPFVRPDLHIVPVDPLRRGHETTYHPGEAVFRSADIVVVGKSNSASEADIRWVSEAARRANPSARIIRAASIVTLDNPNEVRGKRVLVVEDGPTPTDGGMAYGAGHVAARSPEGAKRIPGLSAGRRATAYSIAYMACPAANRLRKFPEYASLLPGYACYACWKPHQMAICGMVCLRASIHAPPQAARLRSAY